MERIEHFSPPENTEDTTAHRLDLIVDGIVIGQADIHYMSKPFPMYQITELGIDYDKQGRGHGTKLMEYIENWLRKGGRAGVLVDAIDGESPAHGMYERRGWIKVPGSADVYAFNLPKGATIEQLRNYPDRYRDILERNGTVILDD